MMRSEIFHYTLKDKKKLNVQAVCLDSFDELNFLKPDFDPSSFERLCDLYRDFIIPKYSRVFGTLVHFYLPEGMDIPFADEDGEYGKILDQTILCNVLFQRHASLKDGEIVFDVERVKVLFESLKEKGCLRIAKGKRKKLSFLPVGKNSGFLSRNMTQAKLKVNANFFLMDLFDLGSVYDQVFTPFGLSVRDGKILQPPLFDREVLIVRDGTVSVEHIPLSQIEVIIDGVSYKNNENACFCSRPQQQRSKEGGFDIVVIGDRVVAYKEGGNCQIPSSGFLIHLNESVWIKDTSVTYRGLEDISFALQVGNSAVKDGKMTEKFESPFYNFLHFRDVSYPPSMYPLNYRKDRAPRIVLGADKEGKPMLLWFEGAAKFGHDPSKDSVGASLSECAQIAKELGMYNGIHLDGGGSAQILLGGERELMISDRKKDDLSENERAVPMALYVL
jgi:hypothetical protein